MKTTDLIRGELWEDSTGYVLARVVGGDGEPLDEADVSSIARKIFNIDSSTTTPVDESDLSVADTIYDELQTGEDWGDEDATGYNFKDTIAATIPIVGGNWYVVEYKLTLADGTTVIVAGKFPAKSIFSS